MKDLIDAITKILPAPLSLGILATGIAYLALHHILDHSSYGDTARAPQFQTCAIVILSVALLTIIWHSPRPVDSKGKQILVTQFRQDMNDTYRNIFISELSSYIQSNFGQTAIVHPIRASIRDEHSARDNLLVRGARMIVYDASVNHVDNDHFICLKLLTSDNMVMSSPPPIRHKEIKAAMASMGETLKNCLGLGTPFRSDKQALDRIANIERKLYSLEAAVSSSPIVQLESYSKRYAVVIGIDQMEKLDHRLRFSASDARAFSALLKEHYDYDCTILIDQMATKRDIIAKLDNLKHILTKNDALLVYFAGMGAAIPDKKAKGGRSATLCPYDFDDNNQIRTDELIYQLQSIPAAGRLLILDVCNSVAGITDSSKVTWNDAPTSLVVLGASAANEYSAEGPKGGVFTSELIEKLSKHKAAPGDTTSVTEISSYISKQLVGTKV